MSAPPVRSSLFPLGGLDPAVFKTLLAEFYDYAVSILGTAGTAADARGTLGISTPAVVNLVRNGSFGVYQRGSLPTADNTYGLDGWRLMLGAANAAVWTRDTSDVPVGAGFASVLTVGSGNNNKFGLFQPIENLDILALRGQSVSIRVPLKATSGLTNGTGKIRIGIMQFTGTADAVSGDPVSSWGAEGTNPTLAANWSFANTPAAISVGTSWADQVVENASISASATNLGVLIWSDDTTNTTSTDVLRIGGYITLAAGAKAPLPQVCNYVDELRRCMRYYQVPGIQLAIGTLSSNVSFGGNWPVPMRTTPTAVTAGFGAGIVVTALSWNQTVTPSESGSIVSASAEL